MLENWKLLSSKIALKTPPFNVLEKRYQKPDKQGGFTGFILDAPNWANVVALNEKKEILLIRQFRIGTDQIELEIPGGIIEKGETPKQAAIRELREETGYTIQKIEQIGFVESNPAIMNNKCYTFVAEVSIKGMVEFDADEIIESFFASPTMVKDYLQNNRIKNAYCVLAFLWYSLYDKSF